MYKIIISNNNKSIVSIISKAQFNRIKKLEYIGGFKRFTIDLYSNDEPKQKSDIVEVLKTVFYISFAELQSLTH
jgi:hypothetical protein